MVHSLFDLDATEARQIAMQQAREQQAEIFKQWRYSGEPIPPYNLLEHMGTGPTGSVYKACDNRHGTTVAVKIIQTDDREWSNRKDLVVDQIHQELRALNLARRYGLSGAENNLEVLGILPVHQSLWMITPFCAGGSLKELMKPWGYVPERYVRPILREVALALLWIHTQKNVNGDSIHGNLKCSNILIAETGHVRLCDFNLATVTNISTSYSQRSHEGSLHWLAPDLLENCHMVNTAADIWAFGALAFEAVTGSPPNHHLKDAAALRHHMRSFGPPRLFGNHFSEELKNLVAVSLVLEPNQRPTIQALMAHEYIQGDLRGSSLRELLAEYQLLESGHDILSGYDSQVDATESEYSDPDLYFPPSPTSSEATGLKREDSQSSRISAPFDLAPLLIPLPATPPNHGTPSPEEDEIVVCMEADQAPQIEEPPAQVTPTRPPRPRPWDYAPNPGFPVFFPSTPEESDSDIDTEAKRTLAPPRELNSRVSMLSFRAALAATLDEPPCPMEEPASELAEPASPNVWPYVHTSSNFHTNNTTPATTRPVTPTSPRTTVPLRQKFFPMRLPRSGSLHRASRSSTSTRSIQASDITVIHNQRPSTAHATQASGYKSSLDVVRGCLSPKTSTSALDPFPSLPNYATLPTSPQNDQQKPKARMVARSAGAGPPRRKSHPTALQALLSMAPGRQSQSSADTATGNRPPGRNASFSCFPTQKLNTATGGARGIGRSGRATADPFSPPSKSVFEFDDDDENDEDEDGEGIKGVKQEIKRLVTTVSGHLTGSSKSVDVSPLRKGFQWRKRTMS